MKDKARSVRLKGTVLYTVVSVLMVLIVFLMGTLALAATASNRAYTNYQKEQTEYTARAVLDSVVQAINQDNTATGIKHQMVNRLQNQGNSFDVNVQVEGVSHTVTITNNGTQSIYNKDSESWVTGDIFEVSTTVDKTMAGTTYSAYIVGEHSVTQTPSGGGGAFVSLGDTDGTEIGTGGYITGGTYIGVGIPMQDYAVGGNGGTTIDSPFYVNGNLTNANKFSMHYRQAGDFFSIMGDFILEDDAGIEPIYDGYVWTDTSYEKLPYIYVGGNFYIDHATTIGDPDLNNDGNENDGVPTNVYCGSIQGGSPAAPGSVAYDMTIYGDVYTFDPTQISRVGSSGGSTALYKWTARTLQKRDGTNAVIGNWYSKGSIEFTAARGGNFVQGDVRAEKNVTITGGQTFEVTGDLVCGGTLTVSGGTLKVGGNIYANDIANSGTIQCNGNVNAYSASTPGNVQDLTGTAKTITIYNTAGLTPTSSKSVWHENVAIYIYEGSPYPCYYEYSYDVCSRENGVDMRETVTGRSGDCWYIDAAYVTDATSTAYVKLLEATDAKYAELKTMQSAQGEAFATTVNFYDVAGMYGRPIYPEDFTNQKITDEILDLPVLTNYTSYPTTPAELNCPEIYDTATSSYKSDAIFTRATAPKSADGTYYEITNSCVLSGTFDKNIYINPGASNPITVVLQNVSMPEGAGGGYGGTSILINDQSQVTLFMEGNVSIGKGAIVTTDYMDLIYGAGAWNFNKDSITDTLGSGMISELTIAQNQTPGSPYYPNVIIYGAVGSMLDLSGNNSLVTALVRAPEMTYKQSIGIGLGKNVNYQNPGGGIMTYGPSNPNGNNKNIGIIGQLVAQHIVLTNDSKWGLIYVTQGSNAVCSCACGSCTGVPSACSCNCGTPGCICTGGAGAALPDRFVTLYYNYY